MKKLVTIAMMLIMVLSFALTAGAQAVTCVTCGSTKDIDCTLPVISCPTGQVTSCGPVALPWECFVFPVCNCPDQTKFEVGDQIGVRMTILTPGVYWADTQTIVAFNAYKSQADACARATDHLTGAFGTVASPNQYWPETCGVGTAGVPYTGTTCSGWTGKFKAMSVQELTAPTGFFTIPDNSWIGYSYWVIEIPDIRIDVDEVIAAGVSGQKVQIKIELTEPGAGGICTGACRVICECTVEPAYICTSGSQPVTEASCMYFPYVLQQEDPWITGLAITNVSGVIAPTDMSAVFNLTDKSGALFTYTKANFTGDVWADTLDNILPLFSGTPATGAAWLKVTTNFKADGYQFMTDGNFGGSTLPRSCNYVNTAIN